ncbi:1,4-dihydroxy-2-naphthoate octaprenyltransferase [candidate division WOR-1 bacterium RIFCSPHIGHO2_01_FULL_53_15]|uniref:1,4-dihydroxy-2-naphthoate octaprenyltransferase n=1 Tax=candidate division WOR-1 bacterium RIFCSPHIGHO2_01_FULL_53_15 TaxID=1802564 RepID=A0A1F4Q5C1_UNCSA|nr:MAG: 1,4-dihydroxy-2-naphthoate octaprenyltransferase [candidate division WOR-1 bacterium RIFCSPHIGHO2_01_FULL_53_15]OGC12662.1 MAG: 1,4-dihydroxy-2-naphthoate octaprenyltransferase [candidate division WOR-1 bacterium RIFCSPHIGHO2_02_FULL_53_26]
MTDRREEIKECLKAIEFGVVSTLENGKIKSRAMHFAIDKDFNFYLASLKGDPKVRQLLEKPEINLLLLKGDQGFPAAREVEAVGSAEIVRGDEARNEAFALLEKRSPVVANMKQGGALGMLEVIRVTPSLLKYRVVEEIMRGVGPTVIEFESGSQVAPLRGKIFSLLEEIRAPFLTASIIPVLLGTAIAWARTGNFHFGYFFLALLGGVCLHAGTNIANDYFDHLSGNDEANTEFVRPFSGGSRLIQKGKLAPREVLVESLFFFALGSLIGLFLSWARGWPILSLGLIGVVSGFFYCAPPFKFVHRGFGELLVGLNFGVLMTLGAYFIQTQNFSLEAAVASLPIAILIAAVLYINEFPDFAADKKVGKDTLVVRLGKEIGVNFYVFLMALTYIVLGGSVLFRLISPFALIGFLTLPRALRAMRVARLNFTETLYLVPANADTILTHLFTGGLIIAAYLLQKLVIG